MTDLCDLWLRAPGIDPVDLDRYGVSFAAAQKAGGVRLGKGGAWVLAVYVDPPSISRWIEDPALLDFCRFNPAQPSQWETVYGAGVMLGEAALEEARLRRMPLPVFKNPLHWLQEAGGGVFPLDWSAFGRILIGDSLDLIGEDLEHSRALRRLVEESARLRLPRVRVAA